VAGTELGEVIVLDADATLVTAHSEKEGAAPTFKHGFGFHPIGVWSDNTGELLAITLRPGNAGSNHAGDHIDALARAIAQIPVEHRGRLLIRTDGAGATHGLLDWLTGRGRGRGRRVEYSVGFPTNNAAVSAAIPLCRTRRGRQRLPPTGRSASMPSPRSPDCWTCGAGRRACGSIVRSEHPHPGAQLNLFEATDGYRYQAFATNARVGQLGFLEARHRAHARVEDRPVTLPGTGGS
jgi:Transposase DDE domain group 1